MLQNWLLAIFALAAPQDSTIVAAVRAVASREPVEAFKDETGFVPVRGIQLLDVDQDGAPEAFVWIDPSFRQTPTVLVYKYDPQRGAHRVLEGLVPGRLQPVSGRFTDDHTMGFGIDMTVGGDGRPVDFDKLISAAGQTGMSLVRYRTFLHADGRKGFVSFVDLSDRDLPTSGTQTCQDFEFSSVEALAAGTVAGKRTVRYLAALTARDVTVYRFRGIKPNETLDKEVWVRPRLAGTTGLRVAASGEIQVIMGEGRSQALIVP